MSLRWVIRCIYNLRLVLVGADTEYVAQHQHSRVKFGQGLAKLDLSKAGLNPELGY